MLPFVALTRYDDIFEVSRNHETWHNTERAVLGREADYDAMAGGGRSQVRI